MSPDPRIGSTLIEVLIAGLGLLVIVILSTRAFADLSRISAAQRERVGRLQATRIASHVLRTELGSAGGTGALIAYPPDSIRVRVFRGFGLACLDPNPDGVLLVRWSGDRRPDPAKDSVLILDSRGRWSASDLVDVTGSSLDCASAGLGTSDYERWTLQPPREGVLVRLFESGSYHVSDGSLRYRGTRGGRQPITETRLGPASFTGEGGLLYGIWGGAAPGSVQRLFLAPIGIP